MTTRTNALLLSLLAALFLGGCAAGTADSGPTAAGSGAPAPSSGAAGSAPAGGASSSSGSGH